MRLLVTGANGFLGRYVVPSALANGHNVRAMVRPATRAGHLPWLEHPRIEVVRADLRARGTFDASLDGVDVVLHLAASKAGDLYEQLAGTVIATENLLQTMARADVRRIVLTSSFAVYEYLACMEWSTLNEQSPLAVNVTDRDEYCQTKLEQERIVREHINTYGGRCVILRPGVIFGPNNLWTARLGVQVTNGLWIRTGTFAPLPLTYVENCADAVVRACEYVGESRELILNVVDDDCPTQRRYTRALVQATGSRALILPVPWLLMRALARSAWLVRMVVFRGRAKLPGLLRPAALHARCKPRRVTNRQIQQTLDWKPRYTLVDALDRSVRGNRASTIRPVAFDCTHVNARSAQSSRASRQAPFAPEQS